MDLREWLKQNRKDVDKKCEGCNRVTKDNKCTSFYDPSAKWNPRRCPMASHVTNEMIEKEKDVKVRVGQQKQKKKAKRR